VRRLLGRAGIGEAELCTSTVAAFVARQRLIVTPALLRVGDILGEPGLGRDEMSPSMEHTFTC
jgi:hypothetical protein